MFPRFIITNALIVSLGIVAWRLGFLAAFGAMGVIELAMVGILIWYGAVGFGCIIFGRMESARHIAHQLPIWGLSFTGTALMVALIGGAVSHAGREAMLIDLAVAIAPNVVATMLLAWLRDASYWSRGVQL